MKRLYPDSLNFLPQEARTDALLPWVISVMLFLTCLSVAASMTIQSGLANWSKGLAARVSVQIIQAQDAARDRDTEATLKMLRATPGIASVQIIPRTTVIDMVSPWLGDTTAVDSLPMPVLIDVELENPGSVDLEALSIRLEAAAPGAKMDNHQAWMRRVLNFAGVIEWGAVGIIVMVLLSTIAIVIFGCRAGLATHRESISIMHLMGAEDAMIAREFDRRYLWHGLKGGLIGLFMGLVVLYGTVTLLQKMGQGLLTSLTPEGHVLATLLLLPVIAGLVTMTTARITVRRALLEML